MQIGKLKWCFLCFCFVGELWSQDSCRKVTVGSDPIRTLLALEDSVWASCANTVIVVDGSSLSTQVHSLFQSSTRANMCSHQTLTNRRAKTMFHWQFSNTDWPISLCV